MKRFLFLCLLLVSLIQLKAQCWKEVSAGLGYSAGIKTDGTLWIWGSLNVTGMGTIFSSLVPIQVGTSNNWKTLSAGPFHLMAIQNNGTLWGMGDNTAGQLGNGTTVSSGTLLQVNNVANWVSVSSGEGHTLALASNGSLWGWGSNIYGQLGDGTNIGRINPAQIGTDTDWQSVSTAQYHSLAIKTNGTLWVWGSSMSINFGYLGLGPGTFTTILPTRIGTDTDWQSISVAMFYNLALKTNGTLWAWGDNGVGQLGDGTNVNKLVPVQIGIDTDWQGISAGRGAHSLGVKTSGTLWAWGWNINGQLGIGNTISTNFPVQVGVNSNWLSMSAGGGGHSLAIRTDGGLWAWGANYNGQIGDGTTVDKNYPVEILSPVVSINASATGVCAGTPVTLSGAGASTYTWTGGVSNGVPFVPASSGVYTVTGSDANGCYNTATISITIAPPSTITAQATSTNVCTGGTVTLSGSGGSTYVWTSGVSDGVAFAPGSTATYTVTDASGCSNTASITVHVNAIPVVSVNNASVCAGSNALLTASVNPAAVTSYSWSGGGTGSSQTVSPGSNSFYTVTATNNGCSSSAVASVSVIPVNVPVTGFFYSSPLCLTASNPLPTGVSGFTGGGTYASGSGITIDPTTGQIALSNSSAGTYVITYSVAANGCNPAGSSTATVSLNAPVAAVTGFSYPSPLCSDGMDPSPLLNPNFTSGGAFSGPGLTINTVNGTIDLTNTNPGTYTVAYAVNAANCVLAGSGTATLNIQANPSLSISSSTTIIAGEQTTLAASSSANTYTWFPSTGLSCSDCASPIASPSETRVYCVRTSDGVCTNSVCVMITVESLCDGDKGFFLPNAFSPNGDGNNDVFCVQGRNRCVSNFQMIIYDRWGEKIFESSDLSACWDGTYKGKVLSPDVFVYYIKGQDQYQKEIVRKGNVSLIR